MPETQQLEATIQPPNATEKIIKWQSDHPEFATVEEGLVTAVSAGIANITATCGGKSSSCKTTVTEE